MNNVLSDDKVLYDSNSEGIWLGTAICHPEFLRVDSNIKPKFFYDKVNECLVWAVQTLAITNGVDNIDEINLESVINTNPAVKKIINESFTESQMHDFVEDAHIVARSTFEEFKITENTVIAYALRRDLRKFAKRLDVKCGDMNLPITDLEEYCNSGVEKIIDRYVFGADSCEIGQKMNSIWDEIVSKRTDGGYGLPFCLERLNEFVSLVPGEMTVMIGETGKGKSSFFMVQALYTALVCNVGVVIIDSELPDDVWLPRALASVSGVPVWKIKTGKFDSQEEEDVFKEGYEKLSKAQIVHEYMPVFDQIKIEQLCRKWVNKGFGLVVLDYLKPRDGHYDAAGISQDLGLQADFMKGLAGRLKVPVLAGQQQSEETKKAADSRKVERYVDTQLYWEEKSEEEISMHPEWGNYRIRVGKNRNGASTTRKNYIDVNFQKNVMRISGAEMHQVTGGDAPFDI